MKKIGLIIIFILLIFNAFFVYLITYMHTNIYSKSKKSNDIKYTFLFIGDGMSLPQVDYTEFYNNQIKYNEPTKQERLSFTTFDTIGLRKNHSGDAYITDSSSSASALASGKLIENGKVNIDAAGKKTIPITYDLKNKKNMKIGIITNQSIDHATPAGFYAYSDSRDDYINIAKQIPDANFDFYAGSTVSGYSDAFSSSYKNAGYKYLSTLEEYDTIIKDGKYIVVSPHDYIPYGMEQSDEDVSISKYLEMALKVLDNKNGFFVMVESGYIDTAAHNNDAKAVISEVNELDKAINIALAFAKQHPDETLIIVTGDHETGSMSLGSYEMSYENLENINMSISSLQYFLENSDLNIEEKFKVMIDNFNVEEYTEMYVNLAHAMVAANGDYSKVIELIREHEQNISGVHFDSNNHTGLSVPVYVYGDVNHIFIGEYTTDEFNHRLRNILKLEN